MSRIIILLTFYTTAKTVMNLYCIVIWISHLLSSTLYSLNDMKSFWLVFLSFKMPQYSFVSIKIKMFEFLRLLNQISLSMYDYSFIYCICGDLNLDILLEANFKHNE